MLVVGPEKTGKSTAIKHFLDNHQWLNDTNSTSKTVYVNDTLHPFTSDDIYEHMKQSPLPTTFCFKKIPSDPVTRKSLIQLVETKELAGVNVILEANMLLHLPAVVKEKPDIVVVFKLDDEYEKQKIYRWYACRVYASLQKFIKDINSLDEHECLVLKISGGRCAEIVQIPSPVIVQEKVPEITPPVSCVIVTKKKPWFFWRWLGYK